MSDLDSRIYDSSSVLNPLNCTEVIHLETDVKDIFSFWVEGSVVNKVRIGVTESAQI
jgi:hypothetical protein